MELSLFLLFYGTRMVLADVDRRDGASNSFNVLNPGRMDHITVLMFLEDITLEGCIDYCIMHLRCHTVSYSSTASLCELNDMEFDRYEADTGATGWVNYGTPPKVDGGFTEWKNSSRCSRAYGGGHVLTYYRSCNNPRPQYGGDSCHGDEVKTERCVCYGAKDNSYGEIDILDSGVVKAVRLSHVSGDISCTPSVANTRWGCLFKMEVFQTYVTDENNVKLFQDPSKIKIIDQFSYAFPGKGLNDDELVLTSTSPLKVEKGQKLRIWYGEDLRDVWESDNSGTHCVQTDLIYEM